MSYLDGESAATGYAISRDGIHWDKPPLDVRPPTNIVQDGYVAVRGWAFRAILTRANDDAAAERLLLNLVKNGKILFPVANRHEAVVEDNPDGQRENDDREESFPCPRQVMSLDREDGDHEVVAEARVAEERAAGWIFASHATDQRKHAKRDHQASHKQVHRKHRVVFEAWHTGALRFEVGINPL